MSVQVNGKGSTASKGGESLATPKKRKHDGEPRESSKKKKKQRTDTTDSPIAVTESPSTDTLKKKKRRTKEKESDTLENGEEMAEPTDFELPDVGEERQRGTLEAATAVEEDFERGAEVDKVLAHLLESTETTSFYSTRMSLYLPIPAISLETAASSVLATHLAPLLLTYFPPAKGIVLGFLDPVISAKPGSAINMPLVSPSSKTIQPKAEVLARTADEFGVSWVWLTVTLLVFRPERGDELYGWTNVTSEGFIGLVSYNYFQTAVGSRRIPEDWKWNGPTREDARNNKKKGRKGRLRDEQEIGQEQIEDALPKDVQDIEDSAFHNQGGNDIGFFTDENGANIDNTLKFRVVDSEVVPGHDRHKWSLQIEGTLLDDEAEQLAVDEDRAKFERNQHHSRSQTPRDGVVDAVMSGARGVSREGSVVSRLSGHTPVRSRS